MLVYANHLNVLGAAAEEVLFRVVGIWLKEQLGFGLHPEQLKRDGNVEGEHGTWVQIRVAASEEPRFFSWVLKRKDGDVGGRQWVTELGMKTQGDDAELSCVVRTDDQSTLITESHPVTASQPRLIRYAVRDVMQDSKCHFSPTFPGLEVKAVGANDDSYKAFLASIERADRDHPLVLVSPKDRECYILDPDRLQERLFGLAQVVRVDFQFNSYDMEEVLGKHWSAWDGAINLIQTPSRNGFVRGKVFRSDEMEGWGSPGEQISRILAWVTHNMNIPRLRKRIRSDGVTRLAIRQQMAATVSRLEKLSVEELRSQLAKNAEAAQEHELVMETFDSENEQLKGNVDELLELNADLEQELSKKKYDIQGLIGQLEAAKSGQEVVELDLEWVFDLAIGNPSPSMCLETLERVYGDRCVVLESARDSAEKSLHFSQGKRLLDLLRRLVTAYRSDLMSHGDAKARASFSTAEFAATESDLIVGNPDLRRERTFTYEGQDVEMFAHLKIGVADDTTKTIRVHFHWDPEKKTIVIGHCGPHLRIPGKS